MRSVSFKTVLDDTARFLGMDPARDLNTVRAATLTAYINTVIRPAWQFDWWPEWMECEQRFWRDVYATGEFIPAGAEQFHTGSQAYYQALQVQIAATQPPATYSAGVWTENSAYWALCKTSYDAAYQTSGEALAVGDQRRDVNTGLTYQIFTAHTAASDTVDTTKAGVLTPFARYISFEQFGRTAIGTIKGVHANDPRVFPYRSGQYNQRLNGQGVVVITSNIPTQVWVEFRQRPPVFTTTPWVSGTAYDLDALVYHEGGVFKSLVGDNDDTLENTWAEVWFPDILQDYTKLAAAALASVDQKQTNRAQDLRAQAQTELERVREQEISSQQEPESAEVMTYGR